MSLDRKKAIVDAYKADGAKGVKKLLHVKKCPYTWPTVQRMQKELEEGGNKLVKYEAVRKHVKVKFEEARQARKCVFTCNLQSWALAQSTELGLNGFKACDWYVENLKKQMDISSRKVTKYFTAKQLHHCMKTMK
jgi:hypothetical protein